MCLSMYEQISEIQVLSMRDIKLKPVFRRVNCWRTVSFSYQMCLSAEFSEISSIIFSQIKAGLLKILDRVAAGDL